MPSLAVHSLGAEQQAVWGPLRLCRAIPRRRPRAARRTRSVVLQFSALVALVVMTATIGRQTIYALAALLIAWATGAAQSVIAARARPADSLRYE